MGRLVRRSLQAHRVPSVIAVVSVAMATGLAMAVLSLRAQTQQAFTNGAREFDAVLGPRGSAVSITLSAVYLLAPPEGTLPWSLVDAVRRAPGVSAAVPVAMGDDIRGVPLVATTPERFTAGRTATGDPLGPATGRLFTIDRREAVVGAVAATVAALPLGARFTPGHGAETDAHADDDAFTVVGVLPPTGTAIDRAVFVPLRPYLQLRGHVLRTPTGIVRPDTLAQFPDSLLAVNAVLLRVRDPAAAMALQEAINRRGTTATFAWPVARVLATVLDRLAWGRAVLGVVATLVLLVAAGAIVAALYAAMQGRARDLALLRALGAPRGWLARAALLEAGMLSVAGAAAGLGAYAGLVTVAAARVRAESGLVLRVWVDAPALWAVPLAMIALGVLAGSVPAWRAYRTDVASQL